MVTQQGGVVRNRSRRSRLWLYDNVYVDVLTQCSTLSEYYIRTGLYRVLYIRLRAVVYPGGDLSVEVT